MAIFSNPLFRVLHWGPLIALGIIFSVSLCTVSCLGQWHNNREMFLDLASSFQLRSRNKMSDTYERGAAASFDNLATTSHDGASESDWMANKQYTPTFWSQASPYFLTVFLLLSGLTLYYYLNAMWGGPGSVPSGWHPPNPEDRDCLQYCETCCSYKPPRAHHCRQCGRCVPKMDHHCPWINTCVGHNNHATFTFFLLFAVLGCSVATAVLGPSVYWAMYRRWYFIHGPGSVPLIFLSLWGLLLNMFVLGLAIGVVIAVGMLLYFQVRSVLRNRTAIEDWILEKAQHRHAEAGLPPFLYPYDLGRWRNVQEVFGGAWCRSKGDGISWTVREGCHQYSLTLEQLSQKACKRARAVRCVVRRPYSGRWLPLTHGLWVLCRPPCTDDPRIPLREGDIVVVTRWKRYWLYGDCIPRQQQQQQHHKQQRQQQDLKGGVSNGALKAPLNEASANALNGPKLNRNRGWFPRHCVVPLLEDVYRSNVPEPYDDRDFGSLDKLKERDLVAVENDDCAFGSRGGKGSLSTYSRGPGEVTTKSVVGKESSGQQGNGESHSKVEENLRHRRNVENGHKETCSGGGGGSGGDDGCGGRNHSSAGLRKRRVR